MKSVPAARALVLSPRGREAALAVELLGQAGIAAEAVATLDHLVQSLRAGAGAAVIAEEVLSADGALPVLAMCVACQPWPDVPILVLTDRDATRVLPALDGNFSVLERPFRPLVFTSHVRAALRIAALERDNALLRAEASLRHSQKMAAVGQLTGGLAHDFNNLLTAIMGSLELIQQRTQEERSRQLATHGLSAVARGARLIRQLLTFSRGRQLSLTALDVGDLIAGMRDLVEGCLAPGMALHTDLAEGLPHAVADPYELELAILNLTINARDAMPQGGTLRIAATVRQECMEGADHAVVVISVSDTGRGMSLEMTERVFEPFFTTKESGHGSGLGLSQVYGMARQAGGDVGLRSTPGLGTTVEIVLPAERASVTLPS